MKRTLNEQKQRILELMSKTSNSKLLLELNEKYLNKLLDKINKEGINSLSPQEKEALNKMSRGEDVKDEPEKVSLGLKDDTLRFTAAEDSTVVPEDLRKLYGKTRNRLLGVISGEAEEIAGNHIAVFVDGDLSQLDKPKEEQDIRMIVPRGEYECVSVPGEIDADSFGSHFDEPIPCYFLLLRDEGTHRDDLDEGNAFVFAAKKAKDAGETKFKFKGKQYKIEESNKK